MDPRIRDMYENIKIQCRSQILAGTLIVIEEEKLFHIKSPLGGFLEWSVLTYNQLRIAQLSGLFCRQQTTSSGDICT